MSEGIGTAAKTVMEITSFLFPDDIPKELINVGSPAVEDEVPVLTEDLLTLQLIIQCWRGLLP
jgi:hypothetical protein